MPSSRTWRISSRHSRSTALVPPVAVSWYPSHCHHVCPAPMCHSWFSYLKSKTQKSKLVSVAKYLQERQIRHYYYYYYYYYYFTWNGAKQGVGQGMTSTEKYKRFHLEFQDAVRKLWNCNDNTNFIVPPCIFQFNNG